MTTTLTTLLISLSLNAFGFIVAFAQWLIGTLGTLALGLAMLTAIEWIELRFGRRESATSLK